MLSVNYPRVVLGALFVIVSIVIVVAASTSGAAFGLYNPDWDGASQVRDLAEGTGASVQVATRAESYERIPANGTIAVVMAPEQTYSTNASARVRTFVEDGGTLLVADERATRANRLLERVGADARLDGRQLRDDQNHYRGPALPVVDTVVAHEYTKGVDSLTLNHGTAVEANGATPLANTSAVAYLDGDGNGAIDESEPFGPFPVMTIEPVGEGRVVVLGDPSVLINSMVSRPGNHALARAMFGTHDRVLLDYSHAGRLPPAAAALRHLRGETWLQIGVGVLAVSAVALWRWWPAVRGLRPNWIERGVRRAPDWLATVPGQEPRSLDAEMVAAHLRREHPEWAPERIDRIVATASQRRSDSEDETSGGRDRPSSDHH